MEEQRFELQYGYMHCIGKTTYIAGTAATLAQAREWVRRQTVLQPTLRVPEADPVRWCPVRHCHMKRQKPWFAFREVIPSGQTQTVLETVPEAIGAKA